MGESFQELVAAKAQALSADLELVRESLAPELEAFSRAEKALANSTGEIEVARKSLVEKQTLQLNLKVKIDEALREGKPINNLREKLSKINHEINELETWIDGVETQHLPEVEHELQTARQALEGRGGRLVRELRNVHSDLAEEHIRRLSSEIEGWREGVLDFARSLPVNIDWPDLSIKVPYRVNEHLQPDHVQYD